MAVNIDPEDFEYEAVTQPVPKARVAGRHGDEEQARNGSAREFCQPSANDERRDKTRIVHDQGTFLYHSTSIDLCANGRLRSSSR
jgi:hypothetical protein